MGLYDYKFRNYVPHLGLNQQVTVGGAAASWDAKGNLHIEPQSGRRYCYSSENQLTAVGGTGIGCTGPSAALAYDPALRLHQTAGAATTRTRSASACATTPRVPPRTKTFLLGSFCALSSSMDDSPPPSFAELAADPEIAPLLLFTPAPRTFARKDGWSPAAQRMFIAWLAHYGSPSNACDQLGKSRSGVDKLYKRPEAGEFRAAWDAAVALAEKRRIAGLAARRDSGGVRGPSLDRGRRGQPAPEPAPEEVSEERMWELMHSIGLKFMRKVVAEREARRNGEIVAADFYLRQITFLELTMEMTSKAFGWDVHAVLAKLRRGDHHITEIVNSALTDWMDRSRRLWWAQEGEPERPPAPDVSFLAPRRDEDGAYNVARDQGNLGACAHPARGYDADGWAALTHGEQEAAWERQYAEDAAAQAEWEARAHVAWRASEDGAGAVDAGRAKGI